VSTPVALKTGFVALFCVAVTFLATHVQGVKKLAVKLSSTLANEIDRVESDESLISEFSPVLKVLSLEGILRWTVGAAHALGGGSYAHVASLTGNHHHTLMEGDSEACPSWWHPTIQSLVLQSCRGGEVVRSEEEIHGIEGFLAVPIGPEEGEPWGAVIVGGRAYGAEEERALKLLAAALAPALEKADVAPGGLDQLSGLPNRASLRRVLRRELSQGGSLTVLALGLEGLAAYGDAARDELLRRLGERLGGRLRAFHYGADEFVVVLGSSDEAKARRTALAIQQLVSEEAGGSGSSSLSAAVGYAFAGEGDEGPDPVLGAALRALREARAWAEGIAGPAILAEVPADSGSDLPVSETATAFIKPLESRDPLIGEHLKAVSRLASRIGSSMSLPRDRLDALALGALLHDVGKIGVPDEILHKPGPLTDKEYETIKRHPVLGAEMLAPVEKLAQAIPAVRHHHERFDGRGYPDGLRGEQIPLTARVVSVADAFDSMIRDRPYGYGISRQAALEEVERNSGTQFDPRVVKVLLEVVWEFDDRRTGSAG
ncbi:MAG TPA: HD domain-containing phosphohydrolase, partial [Rubrobacteraceae bacterium]|nr:HD domain-containing phosphohydrolase [Rubrobacteraceae bacterium]